MIGAKMINAMPVMSSPTRLPAMSMTRLMLYALHAIESLTHTQEWTVSVLIVTKSISGVSKRRGSIQTQ